MLAPACAVFFPDGTSLLTSCRSWGLFPTALSGGVSRRPPQLAACSPGEVAVGEFGEERKARALAEAEFRR